ncbi:membrane protein insertion efficiency factor YidD [Undibacterium arcticum]
MISPQSRPSVLQSLLLLLLRAYKVGISPMLGQNCRFYPSCSDYAFEAIREHGAAKGGFLSAKRLCKCHPWHPGGLDPVPKKTGTDGCRQRLRLPSFLNSPELLT